jgi:iron(III) transport system substrate-binding protein
VGVTYNTRFVAPSEAPRKLEDLLNPKWKGRIASTPNASFYDRLALRPEWDPEKVKAFLKKLSENIGGIIRVAETPRVSSGEFIMLALGHAMGYRQEVGQGAPLGFIVPDDAAMLHYGYLGVPRNSAHPNLAKLFINTVLSEPGQKIMYETYYADHSGLPGSRSAADIRDLKARGIKILELDVQLVSKYPDMSQLNSELTKILREKSP